MKIKTATGKELECNAITSVPTPPTLYLHLSRTSMPLAWAIFGNQDELPIDGYNEFTKLEYIIDEGQNGSRVTLSKSE